MSQPRPPINDPDKAAEQIVAYLDDELSQGDCRELEDRLSQDGELRAHVSGFQQAWNLLDELPMTMAEDRFAATTIEMVAVAVDSDTEAAPRSEAPPAGPAWGRTLMCVGLSAVLTFVVVRVAMTLFAGADTQGIANAQLLDDLPVIERASLYAPVESVQFLRELAAAGLFPKEEKADLASDDLAAVGGLTYTSINRDDLRQALQSLPLDAQQTLAHKQQVFAGLSDDQQDHLRQLHESIAKESDAQELLATAAAYGRWLDEIDGEYRIALASTSVDRRLDHVRRIQTEQRRRLAEDRLREDLRTTVRWLARFAMAHREELLHHARRPRRNEGGRSEKPPQPRMLVQTLVHHWHVSGEPRDPDLDVASMRQLLGSLSPETRRQIKQAKGTAAQWHSLVSLLKTGFGDQLRRRDRDQWEGMPSRDRGEWMLHTAVRRHLREEGPDPNDERQLWKYFNEELGNRQRSELEGLPRAEILERVREIVDERDPAGREPKRDAGKRRGPPPRKGPPPRRGDWEDEFVGPDSETNDPTPPPRKRQLRRPSLGREP